MCNVWKRSINRKKILELDLVYTVPIRMVTHRIRAVCGHIYFYHFLYD